VLTGIVVCFVLSGFAALLYQTAWLRQFSLVFGTSELAVATVLAAYMAGLAGGAAIAARWVDRVRRPIRVYGLLEAGIAISALAVPLLLSAAGAAYVWILGDLPEPPSAATFGQPLFYLVVGFLVLALPTGFMGATLPLLTRQVVRSDRELGPKVALLYASNTAGAVAGTLVAAFVLLPAIGLRGTVWVGVAINALVFVVAALISMRTPGIDAEPGRAANEPLTGFVSNCIRPLLDMQRSVRDRLGDVFHAQPTWILVLMFFSGANAFLYEVLWTRMLSHVLGGSIYAFATMLAAFLTGIALGGGLSGAFAKDRRSAAMNFSVAQVAIALLSIGIYQWMGFGIPDVRAVGAQSAFAVIVMLPATIFIGATLPLAVRILAEIPSQASAATAKIYAWNTAGAIVGAIAAGFYIIPTLEFEGALKLAVLINLALALWTMVVVTEPRRIAVAATTLLALFTLVVYQPERPEAVISNTAFPILDTGETEQLYFAVGRSSTVLLTASSGAFDLRTNGLPEASVLIRGAPPVRHTQHWLTALPVAARPDTSDMLVIGLGGGVALEGVPASVDQVDVIELEPEVLSANRLLVDRRANDPLQDPRINIIFNDARNALRLTNKSYDVIVSQPSHPWTAGASHLFTREFIAIAKDHLNDDGVLLQWMNAEFVDEQLLRSLGATLLDAFEHVRVYGADGTVLFFLASDSPLEIEKQLARTGRPLVDEPLHFSYMGLNDVEDFVAALMLDEEGVREFFTGAPLSTDNRNLMATNSRSRGDGLTPAQLTALMEPHDPLLNTSSWIYRELGGELNFAYIASRLLTDQRVNRVSRMADVMPDLSTQALIAALGYEYNGDVEQMNEALLVALDANPNNAQARYKALAAELPSFADRRPSAGAQALAAELSGAPAAILEAWPLGAEQNWQALGELDRELSTSLVTDIWYPETVKLRADWRTKVVGQRQYAYDALRLVDRVLVIKPEIDFYVLRAAAAAGINDHAVFVESGRYVVAHLQGKLSRTKQGVYALSDRELATILRRLGAFEGQLTEIARTEARASEVRDMVSDLVEEYWALRDERLIAEPP
jgi:spermidine synthase